MRQATISPLAFRHYQFTILCSSKKPLFPYISYGDLISSLIPSSRFSFNTLYQSIMNVALEIAVKTSFLGIGFFWSISSI